MGATMPEPLTPDRLAAIRGRDQQALERAEDPICPLDQAEYDRTLLLDEVDRLKAKLDAPCGSCHPCTNYADETWRAAGRQPPHVIEWDDLKAETERLNTRLEAAEWTIRQALAQVEHEESVHVLKRYVTAAQAHEGGEPRG